MAISRRKFLKSTATSSAGLALPAAAHVVPREYKIFDPDLIDARTQLKQDIYVNEAENLQIHLGYPDEIIVHEEDSWAEFKDRYYFDMPMKDFLEKWEISVYHLDRKAPYYAHTHWYRNDSSGALAFHFLRSLDLGEKVEAGLIFDDCPTPASDYLAVQARDLGVVSLLQKRLFKLGYGTRVYVVDDERL